MTGDEYDEWCRRLPRCSATGKVVWPLQALAEAAVTALVARSDPADVDRAGIYRCRHRHGCRLFHTTRHLEDRLSRQQRQRRNRPETARIKQARQRKRRRSR